LLFQVSLFM